MKEHDDIENLFSDNLGDIEIPVSDKLLPRINETLSKKKKRRFLFWILFGVVFTSLAIILFIPSGEKQGVRMKDLEAKVKNQEATVESQEAEARDKKQEARFKSQEARHKKQEVENKKQGATNKNQGVGIKNEDIKSSASVKNSSENVSVSPKNQKYHDGGNSKNISKVDKQPATSKKYFVVNDTAGNISSPGTKKNLAGVKYIPAMDSSAMKNVSRAIIADDVVAPVINAQSEKFSEPDKTRPVSNNSENKTDSAAKPKVDSIQNKITLENKEENLIAEKTDTVKPRFTRFIGIEGGSIMNLSSYSNQNDPSATFVKQPGVNFNGYFGLSFKEKLNISIGSGYVNLVANYERTSHTDYKDSIQVTKLDSLGNPVLVDSTFFTTKYINEKGKISTISVLIPVKAEYVFQLGSKFKIIPSVGIAYNFLILGKTDLPILTALKNAFSYSAGLKLSYALTKKLQLSFGTEYNKFIKPIYNANYWDDFPGLLPRYVTINAGLRYNFSRKK